MLRSATNTKRFWLAGSILFLSLQAAGGLAWWLLLWSVPASRSLFAINEQATGALLALALPDLVLYVGLSLVCAIGLLTQQRWGWPLLCIQAGAATYAALYSWGLFWVAGEQTFWGALLMTPSLLAPPLFAWALRPQETLPC